MTYINHYIMTAPPRGRKVGVTKTRWTWSRGLAFRRSPILTHLQAFPGSRSANHAPQLVAIEAFTEDGITPFVFDISGAYCIISPRATESNVCQPVRNKTMRVMRRRCRTPTFANGDARPLKPHGVSESGGVVLSGSKTPKRVYL